jgi:hypothetical protein
MLFHCSKQYTYPAQHVGLYKADIIIISLKCNVFLPWYCLNITHLQQTLVHSTMISIRYSFFLSFFISLFLYFFIPCVAKLLLIFLTLSQSVFTLTAVHFVKRQLTPILLSSAWLEILERTCNLLLWLSHQ